MAPMYLTTHRQESAGDNNSLKYLHIKSHVTLTQHLIAYQAHVNTIIIIIIIIIARLVTKHIPIKINWWIAVAEKIHTSLMSISHV